MSRLDTYKKRVKSAYDSSSTIYDTTVGTANIRFCHQLFHDLPVPANSTVLDVGCGTGISTFELWKLCEGNGTFYGIDLSAGMVEHAKQNSEAYSNCQFQQGDAEHLDFPDAMFDLVISNQVLHWIPDKYQALTEMFRVLKPGGLVALLFNGNLAYQEAFKIFLQLEQRYPELEISTNLSSTDFRTFFLSQEQAHELFTRVGFQNTRINVLHETHYVAPERFLQARDATTAIWQMGLPHDKVEQIKQDWLVEAQKQSTNQGFKLTEYNIAAYGTKP
jgi:ubiquinone/menaquinone biosynthesis C-methylase UbiE